jgi:hypothetical protein
MQTFHRSLVLVVMAVVALALSACAGLGVPRELTLSQADLQTLIERQFPRDRRVLEVLDVSLARPVIRLAPERKRIVTELDLSAVERLSGRTVHGSLALDHALRYEPSDASIRLAQVKVQDFKLDIGGTSLSGQGARLGALLAEHLLDDFVIYRVKDAQREALRRAGIDRADIAVTSRGVELHFAEPR